MVSHRQHVHGLLHEQRDSHGTRIKLHIPADAMATSIVDNKLNFIHNHPAKDRVSPEDIVTVDSVVIVTASGPAPQNTPQATVGAGTPVQNSRPATSSTKESNAQQSYAQAKSLAQEPHSRPAKTGGHGDSASSSAHGATAAPVLPGHGTTLATSSAAAVTSAASAAIGGTSLSNDGGVTAFAAAPASASSSSSPNLISQKNTTGMSGGAKAGLAVGILLAFALAGALAFLCWRRRKEPKNDSHEKIEDEKHGSFFGDNQSTPRDLRASVQSEKTPASIRSSRTASTAPRLSLRPVTQFLPNIAENRKSAANHLDAAAAMSEKPRSAWERRPENGQNPFEDAARGGPESAPSNPFDEGDGVTVATAAAAADERKSPSNHSQRSSAEGSEAPTPRSAQFGTASAVPVTPAGAPNSVPRAGPNNVHRVQLDFKPSMEDELELRSGQLVRMLHEYDDGWALCIRMDRSQQGVCPRTCLSKLPVKPRPQGPPPPNGPGPNGRPMHPPQGPGMNPRAPPPNFNGNNNSRPMPPPNGQNRDRSQTMGRSARTPSPPQDTAGRNRSMSAAADRPRTPSGGMPSRKPVPGMAL